jgi:hypothetical protein
VPNSFGSQSDPYVEFPFDRITEVHWGGIAVHFGDGAGPPIASPPVRRRLNELSKTAGRNSGLGKIRHVILVPRSAGVA